MSSISASAESRGHHAAADHHLRHPQDPRVRLDPDSRQSEPVLIAYGGAELEIDFEIDPPFTRRDGKVVQWDVSYNAVSHTGETKERPIGKATARTI